MFDQPIGKYTYNNVLLNNSAQCLRLCRFTCCKYHFLTTIGAAMLIFGIFLCIKVQKSIAKMQKIVIIEHALYDKL